MLKIICLSHSNTYQQLNQIISLLCFLVITQYVSHYKNICVLVRVVNKSFIFSQIKSNQIFEIFENFKSFHQIAVFSNQSDGMIWAEAFNLFKI